MKLVCLRCGGLLGNPYAVYPKPGTTTLTLVMTAIASSKCDAEEQKKVQEKSHALENASSYHVTFTPLLLWHLVQPLSAGVVVVPVALQSRGFNWLYSRKQKNTVNAHVIAKTATNCQIRGSLALRNVYRTQTMRGSNGLQSFGFLK